MNAIVAAAKKACCCDQVDAICDVTPAHIGRAGESPGYSVAYSFFAEQVLSEARNCFDGSGTYTRQTTTTLNHSFTGSGSIPVSSTLNYDGETWNRGASITVGDNSGTRTIETLHLGACLRPDDELFEEPIGKDFTWSANLSPTSPPFSFNGSLGASGSRGPNPNVNFSIDAAGVLTSDAQTFQDGLFGLWDFDVIEAITTSGNSIMMTATASATESFTFPNGDTRTRMVEFDLAMVISGVTFCPGAEPPASPLFVPSNRTAAPASLRPDPRVARAAIRQQQAFQPKGCGGCGD